MTIERPWLASYPANVPAEINVEEFPSIVSVLAQACAHFRDNPAFTNLGKTLTYDDIDRLSIRFASYLLNELKLKKGDRVAMMMPNILQYPIAIFGVLRAGLTVVNTNPMYTGARAQAPAQGFRRQRDRGHWTISPTPLAEVVADTPIKQVITTGIGDLLGFPKGPLVNFVLKYVKKMVPEFDLPGPSASTTPWRSASRASLPAVDIRPDDIAFLQYTGGTTGVAKGAMLTHRNLVANMQQASAWIGSDCVPGEEIIITALPLYHIFALTANCLVFMKFGGLNCPDHQSARHAWLRQGTGPEPVHRDHRREHPVQRPAEHARLRPDRFLQAAPDPGRRHGRAARGRRALEEGHRRAPWSKPTA